LYCFLQMLNAKSRNVCSVEGPAEIQLAGINQARSAAFRRMWCSLSP
jgi:type II secretory ATPase GspE/PulE/Tfp pilus assembly ATPase PilB-like protein